MIDCCRSEKPTVRSRELKEFSNKQAKQQNACFVCPSMDTGMLSKVELVHLVPIFLIHRCDNREEAGELVKALYFNNRRYIYIFRVNKDFLFTIIIEEGLNDIGLFDCSDCDIPIAAPSSCRKKVGDIDIQRPRERFIVRCAGRVSSPVYIYDLRKVLYLL